MLLLAGLLLGTVQAASAQSLTTGSIEGVIVDRMGAPVFDARVVLHNEATGGDLSVRTAGDGRYAFRLLKPGEYSILVEHVSFRPLRATDLEVETWRIRRVDLPLAPVSGGAISAESRSFGAPGPSTTATIRRDEWQRFPVSSSSLLDVLLLRPSVMWTQGLPPEYAALQVDGIRVARQPFRSPVPALDFGSLGTSGLAEVTLRFDDPDVELSGLSAGSVGASLLEPSRAFRAGGAAAFGGGIDQDSAGGVAAGDQSTASLAIGGPILGDTASFVLSADFSRMSIAAPFTAHPPDFRSGSVSTAVSVFGGVDWRLGTATRLSVRSMANRIDAESNDAGLMARGSTSISAGVGLASVFTDAIFNELRFSSALIDAGADAATPGALASPFASGSLAGPRAEIDVELTDALSIITGAHHLKLGTSALWHRVDQTVVPVAQRYAADPSSADPSPGYRVTAALGNPGAVQSTAGVAMFAQDAWQATDNLRLLFGIRLDRGTIPRTSIEANESWLEATGLDNTSGNESWILAQPRAGLSWSGSGWAIDASAGLYAGRFDSDVVGEALAFDNGATIERSYLGQLAGGENESAVLPTATLIPNEVGPSRTLRSSLRIRRSLGAGLVAEVAGVVRRTDRLARRADLNLARSPAAVDDSGRPVYGTLTKSGALILPAAGTNRRFEGFDQVWALNFDGSSDFVGLSGSLLGRWGASRAFVSYAYSAATDNWSPALLGYSPADASWLEGTADTDVPHSVVAGVHLGSPAGSGISAVGRASSGRPFTPLYPVGVDANGDGIQGRDPAVVDPAAAGVTELLGSNPCLTAGVQVRNACRNPANAALDLQATWAWWTGDRYRLDLLVRAFNVVSRAAVARDPVLYRVDAAGQIETADGTVTLPLIANPAFGEPLGRTRSPRLLQVGLRLRH